jgi:putative Holliday junction resolvase
MALDIGDKRIGVATGDSDLALALPKCVLSRKNRDADLRALKALAREDEIGLWVVGLPRQADDSLGEAARKVMQFARRLGDASKIPTVFVDEWESTVEANNFLLTMDASRRRRRQTVDQLAAAIILERYFKAGGLNLA